MLKLFNFWKRKLLRKLEVLILIREKYSLTPKPYPSQKKLW